MYLRAPLVLSACRRQSTSSGWQISGMVVTEFLIQAVISPNSFIRVSLLQPPFSLSSAKLHRLFDWALTIGLLCHWAIFYVTSEWTAIWSIAEQEPFPANRVCFRFKVVQFARGELCRGRYAGQFVSECDQGSPLVVAMHYRNSTNHTTIGLTSLSSIINGHEWHYG